MVIQRTCFSIPCVPGCVCVTGVSRVPLPTRLRVERWSFSFMELLNDSMGRREFMTYLEKEFSGKEVWQKCNFRYIPLLKITSHIWYSAADSLKYVWLCIVQLYLYNITNFSNHSNRDSDSNNNKNRRIHIIVSHVSIKLIPTLISIAVALPSLLTFFNPSGDIWKSWCSGKENSCHDNVRWQDGKSR